MPTNADIRTLVPLWPSDVERACSARVRLSPIILAVRRAHPHIDWVQWISPRVVQLILLGYDGLPVWSWNLRVLGDLSPGFPLSRKEQDMFCSWVSQQGYYPVELSIL